ncbi:MAG: hypothetical protein K8R21_01405, partial [Leptospira sp.]|nr:hypothetical protein [Leptospira sp.]
IDISVAGVHSIKADATSILLSHNEGALTFEMKTTGIEIDLFGKTLKIKNGNIVQEVGDFKTDGNVKAKLEVTALEGTPASVGLSTHLTPYLDSPVGPSVSDPPQGGS